MTDDIQKKRDAIELQAALIEEPTRTVILRTFEGKLTEYVMALLNPELSDGEALALRFKAMGVVETLVGLGADMQHLRDVPIRKAASREVRRSLTVNEPWS